MVLSGNHISGSLPPSSVTVSILAHKSRGVDFDSDGKAKNTTTQACAVNATLVTVGNV